MSGHSKWHNIQAKKGKQDSLRSGAFTKVGRMITVAAREGGGDPDSNFSLRLAVEKAKEINMPKDNVERAIKRGTGDLKDAAIIEEVVYEGFGPGGSAILVEAFTDNKNRSVSDIKNIFSKTGGNLAGQGSVRWQFARQGVIRVVSEEMKKIADKRADFELAVIEAGAEDLSESEFGLEIICPQEKLAMVLNAVKKYNLSIEESGLEWLAKENISLSAEENQKLSNLIEALEEHDDVREVYTNVN